MDNNQKKLFTDEHAIDLKTVIALNRTTNLINKKANNIFRKHALTTMQFAVLEVLYHKGDLKIGQIIEKILSTGGNMTVVIHNLQKEGLINKKCDQNDSRASIISITEKGCIKMKEVFPEYLDDLTVALSKLSQEEKLSLIQILKKLSK